MRAGTIAFLLGILVALASADRPDTTLVSLIPVLAVLALDPRWRVPSLLAVGYLWVALRIAVLPAPGLPAGWEGRDLRVTGEIASPVVRAGDRARFALEVSSGGPPGVPGRRLGRVRVTWYRDAPANLLAGDTWDLTVRLRRPRGFANPGGFDYEGWLFRRGVVAVGYVRARETPVRREAGGGHRLARLRQGLAERIDEALAGRPRRGVVKALTVGVRHDIPPAGWAVLRRTGTAHLVAISGLHVGIVSGLVFLAARRGWSALGRPVLLLPATTVAAVLASGAAFAYAGLAGFSLPTQRALAMVLVAMAALAARRPVAPGAGLAWALLAVLVVDPFAPLSGGFWLSFCAVALLLYGFSGRVGRPGRISRWLGSQWLVGAGLLPLTLYFFDAGALAGPVVNALAIPWTGLLVVPVLLAGVAADLAGLDAAGWLFRAGHGAVDLMWGPLAAVSGLDLVYPGSGHPAPWRVAAAGIGVAWLFAPRGVPGRGVAVLYLVPLLLAASPRPGPGDFWVALLDVGQGTAAVVRTRSRTLVFDTGPRLGAGFDAGRAVLLPYLRHHGIRRVDTLVLSHGDTDHVGGAASLAAGVPVVRTLASAPVPGLRTVPCRDGTAWRWDGIEFRFLHPARDPPRSRNDDSCVLRVRGAGGALLLTGDIEAAGEGRLLARHREHVAADIVVVPHHGSRTSSGPGFVRAVGARYALVPAGHANRYGFPHPAVATRYARRGARVLVTGTEGAVTLRVSAVTGISAPERHREARRRPWRRGGER